MRRDRQVNEADAGLVNSPEPPATQDAEGQAHTGEGAHSAIKEWREQQRKRIEQLEQ